jgi:hypothetical protein
MEGPYPDRTGMFDNPAFYRRDITEGKPGIPLAVTMNIVDVRANCAPVANAVIEVCNRASVKTTQIAFPESASAAVYTSGVYASHGQNSTSHARDNVFSDGVNDELAAVSGSPDTGYAATLTIGSRFSRLPKTRQTEVSN